MLQFLSKPYYSLMNTFHCFGRWFTMSRDIMTQLLAIDASNLLKTCKCKSVTIISKKTGGIISKLKIKFRKWVSRLNGKFIHFITTFKEILFRLFFRASASKKHTVIFFVSGMDGEQAIAPNFNDCLYLFHNLVKITFKSA